MSHSSSILSIVNRVFFFMVVFILISFYERADVECMIHTNADLSSWSDKISHIDNTRRAKSTTPTQCRRFWLRIEEMVWTTNQVFPGQIPEKKVINLSIWLTRTHWFPKYTTGWELFPRSQATLRMDACRPNPDEFEITNASHKVPSHCSPSTDVMPCFLRLPK